MQEPHRWVHVYENPETSEISEEYNSVQEAFDDAMKGRSFSPGAELIRNGEVCGVYSHSGVLYLTAKGEELRKSGK